MYRAILVLLLLLLSGCSVTGIKIAGEQGDPEVYAMFGEIPSRNFHTPVALRDTVIQKWEWEINGGFPQSSVTAFREYLFINDLSGRIYCLNANNGKITGQLKHKGTVYTAPVISRYNLIYVVSLNDEDKSLLQVYNFIEGNSRKETEIEGRVETQMLKLGNEIFLVTDKGLLYKFSDIGDQYWVTDTDFEVNSSPVSDGKIIYIINTKGELIQISAENGNIMNRIETGLFITSGLSLKENSILMGDRNGLLYSMDKYSGRIKWKLNTGSKITAVPVFDEQHIYVVNLAGDILSVDAVSGNPEWIKKSGGLLNSTPRLTDNFLIVPDLSNRVLFIDPADGRIRKNIELPNRAKLSPVIIKNLLIIGFDRGIIRAYEIF